MPPVRPTIVSAVLRHGPSCSQISASANLSSGTVGKHVQQAGAGLIEFSIVAVPILLLGLGSIEVAHWLLTRQVVSLRSEEHTSELQSLMRISYAVFCLKKKTHTTK